MSAFGVFVVLGIAVIVFLLFVYMTRRNHEPVGDILAMLVAATIIVVGVGLGEMNRQNQEVAKPGPSTLVTSPQWQ